MKRLKNKTIIKEPLPDFVVEDSQLGVYPSNKMTIFHSKKPTYVLKGQHKHTNYEFVIAHCPIHGFVVSDQTIDLLPNEVFIVQSGENHGTELLLSEVEFTNIQFEREFFEQVMYEIYHTRNLPLKTVPVMSDDTLQGFIQQYIDEYEKKASGYLLILKQLSISIAVSMIRLVVDSNEKGDTNLERILEYMKQNVENDFSLDDISALFQMSKSSVIRKFKENTGITPYDFFMELKIGRALELLNDPKNRVIDVAVQCGFKNHSHFSSVFKKATGLTPTEYRNQVLRMKKKI